MASIINALTASGGGVAISGDATGNLSLQSAGNTAVTINTSQGVQFKNTIGVGDATPSTSGAGITFPATQSASSDANTLDDYEEGTFSPTVIGTTSAGTATYNAQVGRYTKIGRIVQFDVYLNWSSGTGTGNLRITNLPFTAANTIDTYPAITIGYMNNITIPASSVAVAYTQYNTNNIYVEVYPLGGGSQSSITYDAAGSIILSGCYTV